AGCSDGATAAGRPAARLGGHRGGAPGDGRGCAGQPRAQGEGHPGGGRADTPRHRGGDRPDPEHLAPVRRLLAPGTACSGDEGPPEVPPLAESLNRVGWIAVFSRLAWPQVCRPGGGSRREWEGPNKERLFAGAGLVAIVLGLSACGGDPPQIVDYAPQ